MLYWLNMPPELYSISDHLIIMGETVLFTIILGFLNGSITVFLYNRKIKRKGRKVNRNEII